MGKTIGVVDIFWMENMKMGNEGKNLYTQVGRDFTVFVTLFTFLFPFNFHTHQYTILICILLIEKVNNVVPKTNYKWKIY